MNSNAPGQMLGYVLQLPRTLFHLLNAEEGDVVSVEVIGDVGVEKPDGVTISEEDKSSINGNPVTDRSKNLWKTFYNWLVDIQLGKLDVLKTQFILYSNNSGQTGIVDMLHNAKDASETNAAITKILDDLVDIGEGHEIWKYFDFVVNQNREAFRKLIARFDYESGSHTSELEILHSLKNKYLPEEQINPAKDELLGWLVQRVMSDISQKIPARITQEEFSVKAMAVFSQFRTKTLIDFASKSSLPSSELEGHIAAKRTYVRQLEAIELGTDEIVEAVADYLSADANRTQWIEIGIIDEDIANDMEKQLKTFWKNTKTDIAITQKNLAITEQGKLLLARCANKPHTIRGETPPASTISGTYHLLADEPSLGWHRGWKELFKCSEGS